MISKMIFRFIKQFLHFSVACSRLLQYSQTHYEVCVPIFLFTNCYCKLFLSLFQCLSRSFVRVCLCKFNYEIFAKNKYLFKFEIMCDEKCKRERARAPPVEIPILLNDANIEMGIIERKKEIDNSRKNGTRRGKILILNMCTYASERACVCVVFFLCSFSISIFISIFWALFIRGGRTKMLYTYLVLSLAI